MEWRQKTKNVLIRMEDRGCSPEILSSLYKEGKTQRELMMVFDIRDYKVIDRWFKQSGIIKRKNGSIYTFNEKYFDIIDNEENAYWLGFVWCDGYICKRDREHKNTVYEFKLDISEKDMEHLHKFNKALDSNYEIKQYKNFGTGAFSSEYDIVRLYISQKHFPENLYENYGLIPNRTDCKPLLDRIPKKYHRDFIRGIVDAEGSITDYYHFDGRNNTYKNSLQISTYGQLTEFIQDHFIEVGVASSRLKPSKRHEDRDANCVGIKYSGAIQVPKILDYLYKDAITYLDRKYEKYIKIKNERIS